MEQIFFSVSVFTVVVLILVLILNFAESQLLPQGDVTVEINGNPPQQAQERALAAVAKLIFNLNEFVYID